jgi:D-glycero-D-manno-heptose 1,7-bisphosphate phosphatase
MYSAIFIDKDGTLIKDIPYNVDPKEIYLTPDIAETLKKFQDKGYKIIVISNQSGVAHGFFKEKDLKPVFKKIDTLLEPHEVKISGYFYCPHHPQGSVKPYNVSCNCRKPKPGLFQQAANKLGINLKTSWMIGDSASDIQAGTAAGCSTILFNYYSPQIPKMSIIKPDFTAKNAQDLIQIVNMGLLFTVNKYL